MNKDRLLSSTIRSLRTFINVLPIVIGMLLLTSLAMKFLPIENAADWFSQQGYLDVFIGTGIGSIAMGHPLASYLLGGELLAGGVSLLAVTALIVSWVTVGVVQLPVEIIMLGRHFAIYRNLSCVLLAILVAFMTVSTLSLLA